MQVNIVENPPVEPTYTLTLTLTKDEMARIGKVCNNISGSGPTRQITNALGKAIENTVGELSIGGNQIERSMHLTGK